MAARILRSVVDCTLEVCLDIRMEWLVFFYFMAVQPTPPPPKIMV